MIVKVTETPGVCRWCKCTENNPCENGCSWAGRLNTLCSECVPIDDAMRTAAGRRELAQWLQVNNYPGYRS